jgi:putative endonuclease
MPDVVISYILLYLMFKQKTPAVYIVTNMYRTTLYIGVTSDLIKRVYEHKTRAAQHSFTDKYNCTVLVYYELFDTME